MGEINKIVGRDFIVAFFVPALLFVAANAGLLYSIGILPVWLQIDPRAPLEDTTVLALVTLALAFLLMALNRLVFRALEGYWLGFGRRVSHLQRWRFDRLHRRLAVLRDERARCENENRIFDDTELGRIMRIAASRFPPDRKDLLPTSFGNTVQAFEDYPRVMFDFESITGWSRLNTVLPQQFRDLISARRALTDFWVTVWALSTVVLLESIVIIGINRGVTAATVGSSVVSALTALLGSYQARIAAEQWGEWVKASFDVFLPVLRRQMGYTKVKDLNDERNLWLSFSQASAFRHPQSLMTLESFRDRLAESPNHGSSEQASSAQNDNAE